MDELDINKLKDAPNTINVATNTLNAKINKVKCEIPNIANLVTIAALTTVENKAPNVSDLFKEVDYTAEIKDIRNKYIIKCDYIKFTNNIYDEIYNNKKVS